MLVNHGLDIYHTAGGVYKLCQCSVKTIPVLWGVTFEMRITLAKKLTPVFRSTKTHFAFFSPAITSQSLP